MQSPTKIYSTYLEAVKYNDLETFALEVEANSSSNPVLEDHGKTLVESCQVAESISLCKVYILQIQSTYQGRDLAKSRNVVSTD